MNIKKPPVNIIKIKGSWKNIAPHRGAGRKHPLGLLLPLKQGFTFENYIP